MPARRRVCSAAVADAKPSKLRRLSAFGDLPTRLMLRALHVAPWFLEPVLVTAWTVPFFLLAKPQRRAVAHNLRALHPGWGPWRARWGAWRVILNFAFTYTDAMRCETGTGEADWEIDGLDAFRDLAGRTEGCIILTAHMGNYDIAAPMFSERFGRTLHAVRAPEREPEMQAIREAEMRRKEERHPNFRTLYNKDGMLGVELARLLAAGDLVAVQGDRVIFDVSAMEVEPEPGLRMTLPKGPLFLARATGAPVFPLFIVRDGWRRYRIRIFPELKLPPRRRGDDDAEAKRLWAAIILRVAREHWDQWYVFEQIMKRTGRDASPRG